MSEKNFMGIKIDNHVSIGHIFTTISLIAVCIFAYANMQNDIKNLKETDQRIEKRIDVQERAMTEQQARSDSQYEKMQSKIDKIYEVVVNQTRK